MYEKYLNILYKILLRTKVIVFGSCPNTPCIKPRGRNIVSKINKYIVHTVPL